MTIVGERDRGLPEVAVARARVDHVAAAAEDAGAAREILADPQREQEPRLFGLRERRGRQDRAGEDRGGEAVLPVFEEAVFDSELDIAGSAAPALVRLVGETQRQSRGQLNAFDWTVVEVESGIGIDRRFAALGGGERVNLPVAGVGRNGVVGEVGRAGQRRSRGERERSAAAKRTSFTPALRCPGGARRAAGGSGSGRRSTTASTAEASGRLQFEAALVERLVEEVADRRAERAGEDERRPEQADAVRPSS